MAAITPKNGRVNFVSDHDPHTYWELNTTNLGTNYGDDTSGNDDNSNVTSTDISTSDSYQGMNQQNDPPASGWFDIYTVTDAAALIYIPAGLTHDTHYGIFHNGGGTNAQGAGLRATTTGVEIYCIHVTGGTTQDWVVEEIPDADLPGWFCVGWQFSSSSSNQGDMALWINGTKERSGTRNYQLAYGSGNVDFGNYAGDDPLATYCIDPSSYGGGNWGANTAITSSGILIANFTCDNPNQTNTTPAGNGDAWYEDYYDEHVDAGETPAITDVETDEDVYVGQTSVTITGTGFEADGASSRVRLDSSSAGTGTSQTQTDTSWGTTSIDFTVSLGSLSYGTNYLFVRNNTTVEENATGYAVNLYLNLLTTSLNDTTIYDEQTSIELNGSGFNSSQGSSKIYLCDSSDGSGTNVEQTVTTWTSTKVTFTVDRGTLSLGTVYVILGRNVSSLGDSSERLSPSQTATLQAPPANPVITNIEDETIVVGETEVLIEGSNFEAVQGTTGKVEICPAATYGSAVEQTVDSWSAIAIEFTVVQGTLSTGANYVFITNDSGNRNTSGYYVSLQPGASDEGLYVESNLQLTITQSGLTATAFLISDE